MKLSEFFSELRRRNTALVGFGMINILLLLLGLVMFSIDDTIIAGINAWIKPMKFSLSIVIYAWTFAWLLEYIPDEKKRRLISRMVIVCMAVENGLIYMQAFRGVRSHFNVQTAFDGAVFYTMGIFILINTFVVLYTLVLFFSKNITLGGSILWAWRAGLILFFLGGISGGYMSAVLTHTVGAVDGGPGLPFVNWSTVAGDIRSAHFITLHGLQAIPIATFILGGGSISKVRWLPFAFIFLYAGLCVWLYWIAFQGLPIIAIGH